MKTLLHNCTALLMDEGETLLKNAFVAVEGAKIVAVSDARPEGEVDKEIDCRGGVLMPGLVNAHSHLPMTLMRGYGGGCDLQTWLTKYIFPAEERWDGQSIRCATALGLAEMIASGVTTTADMYYFCDEIAQETLAAGINLNLARGTTLFTEDCDFATFPPMIELHDIAEEWHGYNNGQVLVDVSIHGEYTSNPKLWRQLAHYAKKYGLGMHVHLSETRSEHQDCIGRWGKTPAQVLDDYGVWDTRAIAAHCVWTTKEDWDLMAAKGVTAVHNPVSNMKLGSGVAPVPQMMSHGVNVALGTDGMSSNNCCNYFNDMKTATLIQSGVQCNPMALPPYQVLKMATVNGAKALGRNSGRIAEGCDADLILIDFDRPHLTPCHSVVEHLVYSVQGSDVVMNMSRGQVIYSDGDFHTIDLERVKAQVGDYAVPLLFPDQTI